MSLPNPVMTEGNACSINPGYRFDCFPADGANEKECLKRGCCWDSNAEMQGQPYCYFSIGFSYYNWEQPVSTPFGLEASATLLAGKKSPYPRDVSKLRIQVYYESEETVRIKVCQKPTA